MNGLKKIIGVLLALLSLAKIVGIIVLIVRNDESRELDWFNKQLIYALSCGALAAWLLWPQGKSEKDDGVPGGDD